MIVISDTGPLRYLIVIGEVQVLPLLFGSVLVPQTVAKELSSHSAPEPVRNLMANPPEWLMISPDPPVDPTLLLMDPGERAAISLATLRDAPILIDDATGRQEALRRRLRVTGTLGVLADAHNSRLLLFESALEKLSKTNFYISQSVVARVRQTLRAE